MLRRLDSGTVSLFALTSDLTIRNKNQRTLIVRRAGLSRPHLRPGASGNLCVWQMSCLYMYSKVSSYSFFATFNKAIRQHLSPLSGCKAGKQKWFSLATERHSPQLYFFGTKETLKSILRFSIHRTLLFFSYCHRKKHQFPCWGQRILGPFSGYF